MARGGENPSAFVKTCEISRSARTVCTDELAMHCSWTDDCLHIQT